MAGSRFAPQIPSPSPARRALSLAALVSSFLLLAGIIAFALAPAQGVAGPGAPATGGKAGH